MIPLPMLEFSGPDDDGDVIVSLRSVPDWHLTAHGKTAKEALHRLGEAMFMAGQPECPDCRVPTDTARFTQLAEIGARGRHSWFFDAAENIDDVPPEGHVQPFETCSHPDCALVRTPPHAERTR